LSPRTKPRQAKPDRERIIPAFAFSSHAPAASVIVIRTGDLSSPRLTAPEASCRQFFASLNESNDFRIRVFSRLLQTAAR